MCDTIELLLRLFTAVLVAERKQADGGLPDDLARRLADTVEKPTMGIWFAMSETLTTQGSDKENIGDPAAALISGGMKSFLYGPDGVKTAETSFLRLRNRLAHGAGMPRAEADRLLVIWQGPFERTVQEVSWLADWELIGRDDVGVGDFSAVAVNTRLLFRLLKLLIAVMLMPCGCGLAASPFFLASGAFRETLP